MAPDSCCSRIGSRMKPGVGCSLKKPFAILSAKFRVFCAHDLVDSIICYRPQFLEYLVDFSKPQITLGDASLFCWRPHTWNYTINRPPKCRTRGVLCELRFSGQNARTKTRGYLAIGRRHRFQLSTTFHKVQICTGLILQDSLISYKAHAYSDISCTYSSSTQRFNPSANCVFKHTTVFDCGEHSGRREEYRLRLYCVLPIRFSNNYLFNTKERKRKI